MIMRRTKVKETMNTKPQCLAWMCLSVTLLSSAPAFADASDKAAAEALFQQAKTLMGQKQYGEACEKFRASQELDAGLGTLLHLGDCYEKLGRTASAWATFEEAASVAASRGDTNRQQVAQARASNLKPQLTYVVIRSAQPLPSGATVSRDGRPVPAALWGSPVPVDPGAIAIRVTAPGYAEETLTVNVPVAAAAPIDVQLPALTPTAGTAASSETTTVAGGNDVPASEPAVLDPNQPVATASEPESSSQATWGMVLGGAGIVALGVSAVFTLSGYSSYQESLDNCSEQNENDCGVDGTEKRRDAISALDTATIFGAAGAVVLGAGVVLYVTAPSSTTPSSVEDALSTRGYGLGYRGVW
jgi:tetratricopeptide (TPR) repeat protein